MEACAVTDLWIVALIRLGLLATKNGEITSEIPALGLKVNKYISLLHIYCTCPWAYCACKETPQSNVPIAVVGISSYQRTFHREDPARCGPNPWAFWYHYPPSEVLQVDIACQQTKSSSKFHPTRRGQEPLCCKIAEKWVIEVVAQITGYNASQ